MPSDHDRTVQRYRTAVLIAVIVAALAAASAINSRRGDTFRATPAPAVSSYQPPTVVVRGLTQLRPRPSIAILPAATLYRGGVVRLLCWASADDAYTTVRTREHRWYLVVSRHRPLFLPAVDVVSGTGIVPPCTPDAPRLASGGTEGRRSAAA